jgi:hypothetical protein
VSVVLKRPAKIVIVKKKHKPGPTRYLLAERMSNAVSYFSKNDWTADELREKASSMAIRLVGLNQVLRAKHGVAMLSPHMVEQLDQLGQSFLPKTLNGYKPRRVARRTDGS